METEGVTHDVYARLTGAYWLDSPHDCHGLCECPLDGQPARDVAGLIRYAMLGLAAVVILVGIACSTV
ncbi:hypothetical protein ACFC18_47225 [Streptomyces sp. NPDC056121]|uniref:hypothetical protein n=1 Tax=unclassified Streptomyces TaxID=2593676 RepID=UPI0030C9ED73